MSINSIKNKISEGETLFAEGKTDEATLCFLSVLKYGYLTEVIFNNLGTVAFLSNNIEQSIFYFASSIEANPFYKPAILNYYEILRTSSKFHIILPVLKKYLQCFSDDKEVNQISDEIFHFIESENPSRQPESSHPFALNEKTNDIAKGIFDFHDVKNASIEDQALVAKIDTILNGVNLNENQINKPHRNLIISGVPCSGINLFSNILNSIENIACFDSIIEDITLLPQTYADLRDKVINNSNVPGKGGTGEISNKKNQYYNVINEDVVIGLKQNIAYLKLNAMQGLKQDRIETLMNNYGYRIIAIIRDPVDTIACWNDDKANHVPETMVTNTNMSPRWMGAVDFISDNKIERQAQIWEFYAEFFWSLRSMIKIYTYEQITACLDWVLKDVCDFLVLKRPKEIEPFKNLSTPSHHLKLDEIREAVKKNCPTLFKFGYQDFWDSNTTPGIWDEQKNSNSGQVDFQKCLEQWKTNRE